MINGMKIVVGGVCGLLIGLQGVHASTVELAYEESFAGHDADGHGTDFHRYDFELAPNGEKVFTYNYLERHSSAASGHYVFDHVSFDSGWKLTSAEVNLGGGRPETIGFDVYDSNRNLKYQTVIDGSDVQYGPQSADPPYTSLESNGVISSSTWFPVYTMTLNLLGAASEIALDAGDYWISVYGIDQSLFVMGTSDEFSDNDGIGFSGTDVRTQVFFPGPGLEEFNESTGPFDLQMRLFGIEQEVSAVPVPASLPLLVTGLAGMGLMGLRKRRKAA